MSLTAQTTLNNGLPTFNGYWSIVKDRRQKTSDGFKTWIYLNVFANEEAKKNRKSLLEKDHVLCFDGLLSYSQSYQQLKNMGANHGIQCTVDFSTAQDA